ncbi:hillarin-like [Homarus americanus]|uniref:hillarin-like n=1 Tax=Homarus americanus TaxID=6706 RepID=UPI001C43FF80|nr:hillarin-like [Homarus americanus]
MPASMMNLYENACLRCGQTVYQVDRIGPLKDFSFFHTGCFKCQVCNSKLTLKTYCNNQDDQDDKEVYCSSHVPKPGPGHLDGDAVGIRSALNVPKSAQFVNDQIRPGGRPSIDGDALVLRSPHTRLRIADRSDDFPKCYKQLMSGGDMRGSVQLHHYIW